MNTSLGVRVMVMAAALTALLLAYRYSMKRVGRAGEPGRLKFGGLMWVLGFGALSIALLPVVSYNGKEPWASLALFLGFGIMAIYCLGDAAFVRGTYDKEGIEFSTPWTGMKRAKWRDLQSVELNDNLGWYALKFRSGSTIRLSLMLRGHLSALEMAHSRGESDGPSDDDLPHRRDLPLYALTEDASVVGHLRVAMHFSDAAERTHRANLDAQCYFAGWIPAECPICSLLTIAPVYVTPLRQVLGDPIIVLCLSCDRQVDWSRPFALL
ncbi:MAG TPA: hypothetical protein PK826_11285, partial [Anaerolineae bacterium]|nr:hypothetical protein [Anaerolineae bacterium]